MKSIFRFLVSAVALALLAANAEAQIAKHVVRTKIAGIDVLAYPTGVQNVVTLRGSLPAGDAFSADSNVAIATLTGMLLDKGTTQQDKFAIAQKLESVGATISFGVDTQMAEISAKCLKKDVPLVIGLIAEQLRSPAFSAEDFEKAQKQFIGGLRRQMENTDFRAGDAFSRAIYPVGNPNRQPTIAEFIAATERATLAEVKAFHAKYYGPKQFTLVAVGDLDIPQLQAELGRAFAGWSGGVALPRPQRVTATDAARDQNIAMADKTSVSIVLGQASGLRHNDPDYQALRVATAILGSGFSSRLIGQVRDTEGLTYGIGAGLAHDAFGDGEWRIGATFAPDLLEKGLASTKRHLAEWHDKGVTAEEVAQRKTNLVGEFKVGLATTDGLAGALLNTVHRGYDVSWLDEYPAKINALTTEQVNGAVKKYLNPETMFVIKAGTIPGAAGK